MKHACAVLVGALLLCASPVASRDLGQWAENADPSTRAWYGRQMQPDYPNSSCCGEADAYWTDEFKIIAGADGVEHFFAIVTDDRDDGPLRRPHVDIGTPVEIPPHKFADPRKDPNPTDHGVVFLSSSRHVFCYFNPPGGV